MFSLSDEFELLLEFLFSLLFSKFSAHFTNRSLLRLKFNFHEDGIYLLCTRPGSLYHWLRPVAGAVQGASDNLVIVVIKDIITPDVIITDTPDIRDLFAPWLVNQLTNLVDCWWSRIISVDKLTNLVDKFQTLAPRQLTKVIWYHLYVDIQLVSGSDDIELYLLKKVYEISQL